MPVGSVGLIDADDVGFGLATGADNADLFCLVGVPEDVVLRWPDGPVRLPIAIFIKEPTDRVVKRAAGAGAAVVAVDPRARWERLYRLVNHFFEHSRDRNPRKCTQR